MKKTNLIAISAALALVLSSGVTFAEVKQKGSVEKNYSTSSQMKTELQDRIQKQKDAIKAKLQEASNKIMEKKLDEQRKKIAQEYVVAIRNLNNLADRVESRIKKMEAAGINASTSQSLLDIANSKIEIAANDLTALQTALSSTTSTSTRKAILASVKTQADKTRTDVKIAHKALVDAINSLVPGQNKEKNATSSKESEGTSTASSTH